MYNRKREISGRITGRVLSIQAAMRGFCFSVAAFGTTTVR